MAATDFVTEAQLDSLTTTIATATKANATKIGSGSLDTTATNLVDAVNEVKVTADGAAGGGVAINDSATNTTNAWSSQKIFDEITAAINALVDGAPGAIDTLNELAAALGDDPNFSATITAGLANRLRFDASQTLAAGEKTQALTNLGIAASTVDFAANFTAGLA